MDLREKVIKALSSALQPEYIRLEDDDGISGIVISNRFQEMSTLDRQVMIEEVLRNARLTQEELRRVLMIAGLTPEEYETVGPRIRVHMVRELAGGAVEVRLHGGRSDAEYVRRALSGQKDVRTTNPKPVQESTGVLMSFRANGSTANPLTKERILKALKKDRYIEVMANV